MHVRRWYRSLNQQQHTGRNREIRNSSTRQAQTTAVQRFERNQAIQHLVRPHDQPTRLQVDMINWQLQAYGLQLITIEELDELAHEPAEEEIQIVSKIITYIFYSSTLAVEDIWRSINKFMVSFCKDLEDKLAVELGLNGERGVELCIKYARDDPDDKVARERLLQKQKALGVAINKLRGLERVQALRECN